MLRLALLVLAAAGGGCDTGAEVATAAPVVIDVSAGAGAEDSAGAEAGDEAEAQVDAGVGAEDEAAAAKGKLVGDFSFTYYWIAHESKRSRRVAAIYDTECRRIAKVSASYAERLAMEGTGVLADGRVVNVASPCDCDYSPCFFVLDEDKRFGVGVNERPLAPFRSVAVDPTHVSIGTKLYVPELDGLTMPGRPPWGGFVHDGCVVADDRGGGVRGRQIDFFVAHKPHFHALRRRHRLNRVTVYRDAGRCDGPHDEPIAVDRNSI
ncbi:3D domain-containing protein [Haliangium sp.]|uniref:3D domain-containing protein n=1 Tax=Haliangium sp. TaxID=2663208 RepID=UPI003D14FA62